MRRVVVCVVLACVVTATTASAQGLPNIVKRAGLGGSVGGLFPFDDEVTDDGVFRWGGGTARRAFGFNFGLAPEPGFSPTLGFGWYTADLTVDTGSSNTEIGDLRVRPLMAGIGYTWVKGRVATGVSINAGISFNSIRLNDQFRSFFGPGTEVKINPSNSFAVRPQLRVEYAVARKLGVFSSAGYFFTKFDAEVETTIVGFENEWDASSFNLFVGVMVYPFR